VHSSLPFPCCAANPASAQLYEVTHANGPVAVDFTPDGRTVVASAGDKVVLVN
jgi:hypothetical protein